MKFGATTSVARAITSRYARNKFGFHHIDGAKLYVALETPVLVGARFKDVSPLLKFKI